MSDYRMEIKGQIGLSDYSNIYDYLGIVEDDDVFTIKFDNSNKHDIDIINSMLKGSSFNIKEEGMIIWEIIILIHIKENNLYL